MSKFLKIFVALAAIAAIATPAFAIEADFGGFLQIRGLMHDNLDSGDDDVDDQQRGVDQRFRLYSTFALNENVKAVFKTEIDSTWGSSDRENIFGAGKQVGSLGADAKGQIEVKNIYLDFNIPTLETNVKAGTQYLKLGRGFINGDDATGLYVRHTPIPDRSFAFFWIKESEGDYASNNDESDYYQIQYDHTAGDWHLAPYFGYAYDPAADGDSTAYFLGLDVDGKVGPLGLAATAIVNDWEDDSNDTDGNGLALWGKGTYKMDATTLSLEAAYYGDEDTARGEFVNVNTYHNFSEIITGGRFDGRGGIGQNQTVTTANNSTASAPYEANYMYAKLGASHKYNKSTVSLYLIHAEQAEDTDAGDAITYGQEVDGYYDYEVVPGLTATLAGAYLLADDDFGAGDDAWKLGTALTYKF